MDSLAGLAVAVIVISSVAWVSQYRKIRARIKARQKARDQQVPAKAA
jgi:hypothetical protein